MKNPRISSSRGWERAIDKAIFELKSSRSFITRSFLYPPAIISVQSLLVSALPLLPLWRRRQFNLSKACLSNHTDVPAETFNLRAAFFHRPESDADSILAMVVENALVHREAELRANMRDELAVLVAVDEELHAIDALRDVIVELEGKRNVVALGNVEVEGRGVEGDARLRDSIRGLTRFPVGRWRGWLVVALAFDEHAALVEGPADLVKVVLAA